MVRLGRYFKAPPRVARRQWLKVALLYHYGERFEAGNTKLDLRCRDLGVAIAYLIAQGHTEAKVRDCLEHLRKEL
jgi:hypothetical protein